MWPKKYLKSLHTYASGEESEYQMLRNKGFSDKDALDYLLADVNKYPRWYAAYAGQLPEITVTPDTNLRNDVLLTTYYPGKSIYPLTGHSRLDTPGGNTINIMSNDPGYNLLLNNCSDATREALELATGKRINPWFFTTPGDVRSFAENVLGGLSFDVGDGSVETYINLPQQLINKIAQYAQILKNNKRIANKRRAEKVRLKLLVKRGAYKNSSL